MSAPTTTTGISDEVRDLANQESLLLFVVFAIVFVLAAAAAFALPELRGKTLPE